MEKKDTDALKREIKLREETINLANRIKSLSAEQRKQVETILGGPIDFEALDTLDEEETVYSEDRKL